MNNNISPHVLLSLGDIKSLFDEENLMKYINRSALQEML